ncbi:MAG: hypothetical protein M1831_005687 [Alyxoria varia]|nr:MAG: hypothetical protein M1831_005687 [Alyxoria varia]
MTGSEPADTKRPRLEQQHHYNSASSPHHPRPPSSSSAASAAAVPDPHRRYGPHNTLPHPMHPHPSAQSTDPVSHQHGHGFHARHYSNDPASARSPPTPSHPGSAIEPNPRHMSTGGYGDPYQRPPNEVPQHPPYTPHENHIPHGMSLPPPTDPRVPPSYPIVQQPPESGYEMYGYGGAMMGAQGDGQPRRKAVRASQACESCRAKKCKCDEEKPICGNCHQNGTQCIYREVPPPKQERTMMQVMDQISSLGNQIQQIGNFSNQISELEKRLDKVNRDLSRREDSDKMIRNELRNLREELRSSSGAKRTGDQSQSPAARSQFATPLLNGPHDPSTERPKDTRIAHPIVKQASEQKQNFPGPPTTPIHPNALNDDFFANYDPLNGQLSIPLEHTTAAHKLLTSWETIEPFYRIKLQKNDAAEYVMHKERSRGVMRAYGQGEDHDVGSQMQKGFASPHIQPQPHIGVLKRLEGTWGTGLETPVATPTSQGSRGHPWPNAGGFNPDGSLCLDDQTVYRLVKSFMDNMWILHPFLDKAHVHALFDKFTRQYSSPHKTESGFAGLPEGAKGRKDSMASNQGNKRKRSIGSVADSDPIHTSRPSRKQLERSPDTALLLLVLALGKICLHESPLPPAVPHGTHVPSQYPSSPLNQASPPTNSWRSPPSSATPKSTTTSLPGERHDGTNMSRTSSTDSHAIRMRQGAAPRNVDEIPGFAYHAEATAILGQTLGSPALTHVQACLLAGLYYGQLARVLDSWQWINLACTRVQVLFQNDIEQLKKSPRDEALAIRKAYWTGLQLESDILAELDLPHSGISRIEDVMAVPDQSSIHGPIDEHDDTVMLYYTAQIHIRRILNRAHSALYNSSGNPINPGWAISNSDELSQQLEDWRNLLPKGLRWGDRDEPAQDINDARLRAKYYGARYIIHRPFLHFVLHQSGRRNEQDKMRFEKRQDCLGMARKCVDAAMKSTTAFDGVPCGRLLVTNIFGTAHAQFGNILVLGATARSDYAWMIDNKARLAHNIQRTIDFINKNAAHAPTMDTNVEILRNVQYILRQDGILREDDPNIDMDVSGSYAQPHVATPVSAVVTSAHESFGSNL